MPTVDALADTVGGEAVQRVLGKVKPGGRVGSVVGEPAGAKARGLEVRSMMTHPDPVRLAELAAEVAAGRLVIPIERRLPLGEVAHAHEVAERAGAGKVVFTL
jgi:NADPH:quinone reductase-like Zn-dependent oxidoreductase